MLKLFLSLFLFCFISAVDLPESATVGFMVYDLHENRLLISKNENQYFIPASITKLFTASRIIKQFGPYYQFKTSVYYEGPVENGVLMGNIYLDGDGDPLFDEKGLEILAKAVKTLGIHLVQGTIILKQRSHHNPHYEICDLFERHATDFSLLNLNRNCKTISLVIEEGKVQVIANQNIISKIVKAEADPIPLKITSSPFSKKIVLEGSISENTTFSYPARPLSKYIKKTFQELLEKQGIVLLEQVVKTQIPKLDDLGEEEETVHFLAAVYSKQLHELCSIMLKDSDNLIADTFSLHFPQKGYLKLVDGSGMSRHNKVTCNEVITLLKSDWQTLDPYLAVAGVNGTLKSRFKDTFLENRMIAKTGGMEGVVNLAGFWINEEGHPILFAFMINNSPLTWGETKEKVDSFLIDLLKPYD